MKRVIFACVHNAGRSQIAAAYFNALANPALARAISAGTEPAERVHDNVVEVMREVGIDLRHAKPRRLTAEIAADADLLVTMGCGEACPVLPEVRKEDWRIEDPKGLPVGHVRRIRDEIRRRIVALLEAQDWTPRAAGDRINP